MKTPEYSLSPDDDTAAEPGRLSYVIVSPVRDEAAHVRDTIRSVKQQTVQPRRWIIVDDGSTDETAAIVAEEASAWPVLRLIKRANRGYRRAGAGVMEAFYAGYQELDVVDWDLLVKLDGDLSLPTDYFESCISEFAKRPKLGIGGGLVCKLSGDQLLPESPSDPVFHVRGAVKMYRVECWRDIGGLVKGPCWDSIDELHANMLQWETQTFIEVKAHHKRPAGAAYGPLKDWAKGGRGNYITGYHPLFFFVKCLRRLLRGEVTAAAGLSYGYMAAQLRREKRMVSKTLMTYIRREQLRTLLGRQTLWAKSVRDRPA